MQNAIYPSACRHGHVLNDATTYVSPGGKKWRCRECLRECSKRYRANRRQALLASGYKPYDPARRTAYTTCREGHTWTPENTYTTPSNPRKRQCKICRNNRNRAGRQAGSLKVLHQLYPEDGFYNR